MKWMKPIAFALVILFPLLGGCTTAYQEEQRRLYWQKQSGEISESEYEQRLREQEESQSWGGVGGVHEEDDLPVWIHPYELNRTEQQ